MHIFLRLSISGYLQCFLLSVFEDWVGGASGKRSVVAWVVWVDLLKCVW